MIDMKKLLILLLLVLSFNLYSQEETNLSTPHKVAVMPHTGQLSLNIELFKLIDPDYDVTFSLDYVSSAFEPVSPSGTVGTNWGLSIGGQITRHIVGLADDAKFVIKSYPPSMPAYVAVEQSGLLSIIRDTSYATLSYDQIFSSNFYDENRFYSSSYESNIERDLASDIYTFSVFGHSGTFVIDLNGVARVISGDFMKIDIDSMGSQRDSECISNQFLSTSSRLHPNRSLITLTDLDGYKYTFGGNAETMSYSMIIPGGESNEYQSGDVQDWYLSKVTAPNGRSLIYHYRPIDPSDGLLPYNFRPRLLFDTMSMCPNNFFPSNTVELPIFFDESPYQYWSYYYSLYRSPLLDSITTSDDSFSVIFTYSPLADAQYGFQQKDTWGTTLWFHKNYIPTDSYFISDIAFRNDSSILSEWHFSYTPIEQTMEEGYYVKQYLSGVRHTSGLSYQFTYKFSENPQLDTQYSHWRSVDRMGYYISDPTLGSLLTMTDPLGGITSFSFSRCRYDSIRIPALGAAGFYSVVKPISEQRINNSIVISSISKYDDSGMRVSCKRYEYGEFPDRSTPMQHQTPYGNSTNPFFGQSSGILNVDFAIDVAPTRSDISRYMVKAFESPGISSISSVEYGMVKEINLDKNNIPFSHSIYYYDTTPDLINASWSSIQNTLFFEFCPYWLQSNARSRLRQIDRYSGDRICESEFFDYPSLMNEQCPSIAGRIGKGAMRMYYPPSDWKVHRKILYENNGQYSTSEMTRFDGKRRVSEILTYASDKVRFVQHTYPDQLFTQYCRFLDSNAIAYGYLWLRNRIGNPVQTISGFVKDSTYFVTNGVLSLYDVYNWKGGVPALPWTSIAENNVVNESRKSPLFPTTEREYVAPKIGLQLHLSQPLLLSDFTTISCFDGDIVWDTHFDTISTVEYNEKLRPVRINKLGHLPEIYEWDAKGLNVLSRSQGIFHHTYTYIPYLGISSETDERGITTYYSYDSLGNVIESYQYTSDGEKVIIEKKKYHYKSQQ